MLIQFLFLSPLEVPYSGESSYYLGGKQNIAKVMTRLAGEARDTYKEIAKAALEYREVLNKFAEFLFKGIYETEKK